MSSSPINLLSVGLGVGATILGVLIGWGLSKIKRKREKPTFMGIKSKLTEAYEANKQSAILINELYSIFNEIETEVKKI